MAVTTSLAARASTVAASAASSASCVPITRVAVGGACP